MVHTCVCGASIESIKESHKAVSELSNSGTVQHNSISLKCPECGKLHISQDDPVSAFDSFDSAVKQKNIR